MLELREVSRTVAREALLTAASVSFTPGTPTAILGLSPGGRTAFVRLLAGVDRPDVGTILLDGRDIGQVRRSPGQIALMEPTGAKPSGRTARKMLADAGRRAAGSRAEAGGRISRLVSAAGLDSKLDATVKSLDSADRIRLALVAACAGQPRLLLIDAPSQALPEDARAVAIEDIARVLAETEAVVIVMATAEEAIGLGGRVIVLDRGRVAQQGAAAEVFANPNSLTVALATSRPVMNTLDLDMRGETGRLKDGSTFHAPPGLALPHEGACTLAFRPEHVRLQRGGESCVRFVTRVVGEETIAGGRYARLAFADASWLTPLSGGIFPVGVILNAFVECEKLLVFDAAGRAFGRSLQA
jgi:glycerol transport system ATP-binding protein